VAESDATFDIVGENGDVDCIIKLQGVIDLRALPRLRGVLSYALDGHPARLIIDLADVDSVDVSGLAVLVGARYQAGEIGLPVLLQSPNAGTLDLLAKTGLDRVLPIINGAVDTSGDTLPTGRRHRRPSSR
jgi:anti-sigma B factor antagonist